MIRVALRFDDPSATSDHALEAAIFQKLERHGVPITVAAIPYRQRDGDYVALSADHAGHLLQAQRAGLVEIALHGYSHEERGGGAHGAPSEFAGVPALEQRRLIEVGRAVLQDAFGCDISGFVPPFNTCVWITRENCSTGQIAGLLRANAVRVAELHAEPQAGYLMIR